MKPARHTHSPGGGPRGGFTLIELLVIIAIIGVLAALTAGAVIRTMAAQRESNTGTVIRTVDKVLQQHWTWVVEDARKEALSAETHPQLYAMAGGDPKRARVIWVKLRLVEAFPMTFAEIYNPPTNNFIPQGKQRHPYLSKLQEKFGATVPASRPSESAACLLLALEVKRGGISFAADTLGSNAIDADGDGLPEFLDGWGNPLVFIRFPTDHADLDQTNPAATGKGAKFRDPQDPEGLLMTPIWNNFTNYQAQAGVYYFEQVCHRVHVGATAATYQPQPVYMVPIIVSAGGDSKLGLNAVGGIVSQNDANDNVYSFRLRLGAKGE